MVNFHDIVDSDERSLEHKFSYVFVGWLVESLPFRMILLVAILLDSLTIGIQTNRYLVRVVHVLTCDYMRYTFTEHVSAYVYTSVLQLSA